MSVTYSSSSTLTMGFLNTHTLLTPINILRSWSHGFFLLGFLTIKMPELCCSENETKAKKSIGRMYFKSKILITTNLQHSGDVEPLKYWILFIILKRKGNFLQEYWNGC